MYIVDSSKFVLTVVSSPLLKSLCLLSNLCREFFCGFEAAGMTLNAPHQQTDISFNFCEIF